jgi:molybdate transport system substrate-binding protein
MDLMRQPVPWTVDLGRIVYPLAVIAGQGNPDVKRFMDFLRSPQSADIFKRYGFEVR